MKEYNKSNIPLAKELRKNMTPWGKTLVSIFKKLSGSISKAKSDWRFCSRLLLCKSKIGD